MKLRRFSTKPSRIASNAINVLGNAFQHAAWFEDESGQRHPAEVGTGTELADDVHEYTSLCGIERLLVLLIRLESIVISSAGIGARPKAGSKHVQHNGPSGVGYRPIRS